MGVGEYFSLGIHTERNRLVSPELLLGTLSIQTWIIAADCALHTYSSFI